MSGIVTIEDLLEELVGEMFSEQAEQVPQLIRRQPDGSVIVSGGAPIREVNRELDIELPDEGNWTTVAGLWLALAGHIPSQGETIELPNGLVLGEVVECLAATGFAPYASAATAREPEPSRRRRRK